MGRCYIIYQLQDMENTLCQSSFHVHSFFYIPIVWVTCSHEVRQVEALHGDHQH